MKRAWIFFMFFYTVLFTTCLYAQTAKIIDIKGNVLVKKEPASEWEKAKLNMFLLSFCLSISNEHRRIR